MLILHVQDGGVGTSQSYSPSLTFQRFCETFFTVSAATFVGLRIPQQKSLSWFLCLFSWLWSYSPYSADSSSQNTNRISLVLLKSWVTPHLLFLGFSSSRVLTSGLALVLTRMPCLFLGDASNVPHYSDLDVVPGHRVARLHVVEPTDGQARVQCLGSFRRKALCALPCPASPTRLFSPGPQHSVPSSGDWISWDHPHFCLRVSLGFSVCWAL